MRAAPSVLALALAGTLAALARPSLAAQPALGPPPLARFPIARRTFVLGLESAWQFRSFADTEPSAVDKRYSTPGNFGVAARAELYPFARAPGFARDIGLTGVYARALDFASRDFDTNQTVDTHWYRFGGGVRVRAFPRARDLTFGAKMGVERWVFDFETGSTTPREVPRARYTMLYLGVDGRQAFGKMASVGVDLALLYPAQIATLGDREPYSQWAYGVRGALGFALSLSPAIEVELRGEYAMLRFQLRPLPNRSDEPGRVFDQYVAVSLGVTLAL